MRSPRPRLVRIAILTAVLGSVCLYPALGGPMRTTGASLQIRLGLKDKEPIAWDGRLDVIPGRVLSLTTTGRRNRRTTENAWQLRTQPAGQGRNQRQRIQPIVLLATLDARPSATVKVTTPKGEISFALSDLPVGGSQQFLDGQVGIQRWALSTQLTEGENDNDFPSATLAPDGTMWLVYASYQHGNPTQLPEDASIPDDWSSFETKGNGDRIKLMRYDGENWSEPMDVLDDLGDLWKPSVAVSGTGEIVVIWSQKVDGNWDLYGRGWDPLREKWSDINRLTEAPGADLNAVCATDSRGTVHVVWQGWRGEDFDILHRPVGPGPEMPETMISASPANDWHPSVAIDSNDTVFVAWDTYDKGNYDVMLRAVPGTGSVRRSRALPVATTPRFEARPSLACDSQDRLWLAFEQADPQWAKDFGTVWKGPSGVPFYLDRDVVVRCVSGGKVMRPTGEISGPVIKTMYPPSERKRLSMPQIGVDDSGNVWVVHRRHPLATGAGTRWDSYASHLTADGWSEPLHLPNSGALLDNWPVLLPLKDTGLVVIQSSDGRGGNRAGSPLYQLYATVLDSPESPASPVLSAVPRERIEETVVHPNEAADIRRMRDFRVTVGGRTYQLLRGEFHRHTAYTSHRDQDGPFEEMWRYGLDVARMDWIGNGDHDNGGHREYCWWIIQKYTDFLFHPPTFIPMFTYERSVVYPSGHRNVMFTRRGIRPLPRAKGDALMGNEETGSPDIKRLYAYLKYFGAFCSSHTSATNMGTDWRDNDPEVEPVVEIYQGHRQNYEEPNGPMSATGQEDAIGGYRPAGFVWNALAKGYRLGFQVSSDHVSTHLSYAVVLAEEPTREAIVDAFMKRHSYGANDNIVLLVRCGDHLMGDEFTLDTPPRFDLSAIGTGPIARIAVVRDNEYVYTTEPNKRTVKLTWADMAPKPGQTSYYYFRIEQANGALAWASPMWIRYTGA